MSKKAARFSAFSSLAVASAGSIYNMVIVWTNKIPMVFMSPNPRAWNIFEFGLRLFVIYWLFMFPCLWLTSFAGMDLMEEISKARRLPPALSVNEAIKSAAHIAVALSYFIGIGFGIYQMRANIHEMAASDMIVGLYGIAVLVITVCLTSPVIGLFVYLALRLLASSKRADGQQIT